MTADRTSSASGGTGWSSDLAFILATVGAAVGLGNIWRFPTLAGENGGGAFVLLYIAFVILIGLPMMLAEILVGRAGGKDAVGSVRVVAERSGASRSWALIGAIEILAAFLILSFYSVVAGWVVNYVLLSAGDLGAAIASGDFLASAMQGQSREEIIGHMGGLFASPARMVAVHIAFMAVTVWIVANGVHDGIERAATWLMPGFFLLLVGLTVYGSIEGDFAGAVRFLFTPDFARITPTVVNDALGQAFFSLSLGAAGLMTYGAYVGREVNLANSAGKIAAADTLVAIIAGLMIFPIVFSAGMDPAGGPPLIFETLPLVFNAMPGGALLGFLFFVLIFVAALTSAISLLEGPTAWLVERSGWRRPVAASCIGVLAACFGILCALGYNVLADVRPLWFWSSFAEMDILDAVDAITGRILLPIAGLLLAIFVGWRADSKLLAEESGLQAKGFLLWRFSIAWLAPLAVLLILVAGLFPSIVA